MRKAGNKGRAALIAAVIIILAAAALIAVFGGDILRGMKRSVYPIKYVDEIRAAAEAHGLDPALVFAVVDTESGFRSEAVSRDGAEGLMQVLPSTAEWIDYRRGTALSEGGLFDPEVNLDYGCWLLRYLLDRYDGNERHALIAYNAGFGRADEWLNDPTLTDGEGNIVSIPYPETRSYVDKVLHFKEIFREVYEQELG